MSDFSKRLKEALEYKNMRPVELGRRTGIGKSSISMYLSGENEPRGNRLHLIAQALDVNESFLLGYYEKEMPINKQKYYKVDLCMDEIFAKIRIPAVSKNEAIGIAVKLISKATYENIISVEEDV